VPCLHKRSAQWFEVRIIPKKGRIPSASSGRDGTAAVRDKEDLQVLQALKHPNVLTLSYLFMERRSFYVVRPVAEDAVAVLHAPSTKLGSVEFAREVAQQSLNALAYCHRAGISHLFIGLEDGLLVQPSADGSGVAKVFLTDAGIRHHPRWPRQGERIEVYSRSRNNWLDGIVQSLAFDNSIMDGYAVDAGTLKVIYGEGQLKYIPPDQVAANIRQPCPPMEGEARLRTPTLPANQVAPPVDAVGDLVSAAFAWGIGHGPDMTAPRLLTVAPEVIAGNDASEKADIWSIGVIVFVLLCGRLPYADSFEWQHSSPDELLQAVREPVTPRTCTQLFSHDHESDEKTASANARQGRSRNVDEAVAFCTRLLCYQPQDRCTAEEAGQHAWLAASGRGVPSEEPVESEQRVCSILRRLGDVLELRRRVVALVAKQLVRDSMYQHLGSALVRLDESAVPQKRVSKEAFDSALQMLGVSSGIAASAAAAFLRIDSTGDTVEEEVAYVEFIREVAAHARGWPEAEAMDPMPARPAGESRSSSGDHGGERGSERPSGSRAHAKSRVRMGSPAGKPDKKDMPPPMPVRSRNNSPAARSASSTTSAVCQGSKEGSHSFL